MEPNLVILAGGISSRMKNAVSTPSGLEPGLLRDARDRAKSMIGIGEHRRPFLDYVLFNAREAGYRDIIIVTGEHDSSIREHYGPADEGNEIAGLRVSYAIQPIPAGRTKPLGTADALLHALRSRAASQWHAFTVCNSDNLYSRLALKTMLECPDPGGMIDYDRAALEFSQDRIEQFAVTEISPDGYLIALIEKPSPDVIVRLLRTHGRIGVSMNIFRLTNELIRSCLEELSPDPVRQEKELPAAVQMMARRHPGSVRAIPLAEHVPDLTHPSDILAVQQFLETRFPDFSLDRKTSS